jgi:hypothetical protein
MAAVDIAAARAGRASADNHHAVIVLS